MPQLTFREKIERIINSNPYDLGTVNAIEDFCGLGRSTLKKSYDEDREPSIRTVKKILANLRIVRSWWDNPIGEPFIDLHDAYKSLLSRMRELEQENYELKKRISTIERKLLV